MADTKISDLPDIGTTVAAADVLPIVDNDTSASKKITVPNLRTVMGEGIVVDAYSEALYQETVSASGTLTIDYTNGNRQEITISGTPTLTLAVSNFPAGGAEVQVVLINGVGATWTLTALDFGGAGSPTFTSGTDMLFVFSEDAAVTTPRAGYLLGFA